MQLAPLDLKPASSPHLLPYTLHLNFIHMQIINPATEEVIQEIAEDSPEMILKKFQLVREGQPAWAAAIGTTDCLY